MFYHKHVNICQWILEFQVQYSAVYSLCEVLSFQRILTYTQVNYKRCIYFGAVGDRELKHQAISFQNVDSEYLLPLIKFQMISIVHNRKLSNWKTKENKKTQTFNTLRPRQNRRHFTDDILKCIFLNEYVWIPIEISLKFVPKGPIDNILALV